MKTPARVPIISRLLLVLAALGWLGAAASGWAQVYSVNVVGYVSMSLPRVVSTNMGYLIANPLSNTNNSLDTVLPLPDDADGTQVFRFDPAAQTFTGADFIAGIGWFPEQVVNLGEGWFLRPWTFSGGNLNVTFVGEVPQGHLVTPMPGPGQTALLASAVPQTAPLGDSGSPGTLQFPAEDGDAVWLWNSAAQAYGLPYVYLEGYGWLSDNPDDPGPAGPVIGVGQGFRVTKSVTATQTVWVRDFIMGFGAGFGDGVPAFLSIALVGSNVRLTWSGSASALQQSTDLASWTPVAGNPTSPYTAPVSGPRKFYRLLGGAPCVNVPPTLSPITDLGINEDAGLQTVNLSGITSGTSNEVQTLTVTASSNPSLLTNLTVNHTNPNTSGSVSFRPISNASGSALVTVTVNDGATCSNLTSRSFTVTVNPVNDPPTLDPIPNRSISEDAGQQTVNLTGISSGTTGESDALTVTASNTAPSLLTNLEVSYTSPNPTGNLTFGTVSNAVGSGIITVTVDDGRGSNNLVSRSFTVTVSSPPRIVTQPQTQIVWWGGTAAFSVEAAGTPPFGFFWRTNGVNFARFESDAGTSALLLTNVPPDWTGWQVDVRITNAVAPAGVLSQPAYLYLLTPPILTTQPADTNVAVGERATFCAAAIGDNLRYQWLHNGVNIANATNDCLTIDPVQLSDGGSYSLVIENAAGTLTSLSALLRITVPTLAPGDHFADRVFLSGISDTVGGTNLDATREPGEPLHAGKPGAHSVWYAWTAPQTGIATVRTIGSTFDTLLAVYTGASVDHLTAVVSDEDRGGYLTSEIRFNAQAGTTYAIAVDGYAGESGDFILTWDLEVTPEALPVITTQPVGGSVLPGTPFTFTVAASGGLLTYQWYFLDNPIPGATDPSLTVSAAGPTNVGTYTVQVSNVTRTVFSAEAGLELGTESDRQSQDKLQDLFSGAGGGLLSARRTRQATGASLVGGFVPVTLGTADAQVMDNVGATKSALEPNHAEVIGGSSKWFGLRPESDGVLVIDTFGSTFDTVLAVYAGPTNYADPLVFWSGLVPVAANNDAPATRASQVSFNARGGTNYMIAVDGLGGAQGTIQLHWQLIGPPPVLAASANKQLVRVGSDVRLRAFASSPPPGASYQWRWNGVNVEGATGNTLLLCNLSVWQGGDYTVVVTNALRSMTRLVVADLEYELERNGPELQFRMTGASSENVALDRSADLRTWTPVLTNEAAAAGFSTTVTIPPPPAAPGFYRLRTLP